MTDTEELTNFYASLPKKFKEEEVTYPTFNKYQVKLPFRMCVTGTTGSGKTNAVLNLAEKINAFDKVMIFAKDTEEALYASFIDKLREAEKKTGTQILTVSNNIDDLPSVDTINKKANTLLLVDDMVTEKDKALAKVSEYWIRGRKKNVSCVFLSQSYFGIPIMIRKNTSYFIFTKIGTDSDLARILKDFQLGVSESQIIALYKTATAGGFPNFLMVDVNATDPSLRFRRNFKPIEASPPTADDKTAAKPPPSSGPRGVKRKQTERKTVTERYKRDETARPGTEPAKVEHTPEPVRYETKHRKKIDKGELKEYHAPYVPHDNDADMWNAENAMEDADLDYYTEMGDGLKRRKTKSKKKKITKRAQRPKSGKALDDELRRLIGKL